MCLGFETQIITRHFDSLLRPMCTCHRKLLFRESAFICYYCPTCSVTVDLSNFVYDKYFSKNTFHQENACV